MLLLTELKQLVSNSSYVRRIIPDIYTCESDSLGKAETTRLNVKLPKNSRREKIKMLICFTQYGNEHTTCIKTSKTCSTKEWVTQLQTEGRKEVRTDRHKSISLLFSIQVKNTEIIKLEP